MNERRRHAGGFTLIELILATLMAAGIAAAVMVSLSQALRARAAGESRQQAFARASAAADRIALDALNLVRSADLYDVRVLLVDGEGDAGADRDEVLFFSQVSRSARVASEQNEGGVHEVQYRLETPPDPAASGYVLWRRADPVPDVTPDGGGIASPIVQGIVAVMIDAFDGENWHEEWDSDRDGLPHALRITTLARSEGDRPAEAYSRRTVSIDRVPAPVATVSSAGGGS